MDVVQREAPTLANNVLGVLVGLKYPNNIPSDAKIFIEVLHSAAFPIKLKQAAQLQREADGRGWPRLACCRP